MTHADSPAVQIGWHYSRDPAGYMATQVHDAALSEFELRGFWQEQIRKIQQTSMDPGELQNQQLPLTRIKKVKLRLVFELFRRRLTSCVKSLPSHLLWYSGSLLLTPNPLTSITFWSLQIMKSDESVRIVAADAPLLLSKVSPFGDCRNLGVIHTTQTSNTAHVLPV
jgi:hypothetical protein